MVRLKTSLKYGVLGLASVSLVLFLDSLLNSAPAQSLPPHSFSQSAQLHSAKGAAQEGDSKLSQLNQNASSYSKSKFEFSRKLKEQRFTDPLLRDSLEKLYRRGYQTHDDFGWDAGGKMADESSITTHQVFTQDQIINKFYGDIILQASKIKASKLKDYLEDCNLEKSQSIKEYSSLFSAIERATSDKCKSELAVVGCMSRKQTLYPRNQFLPNYCTDYSERDVQVPVGVRSDSKVKIVFLLQLSGRSERQVERLLKDIYSTRHAYLLHVDTDSHFLYDYLSQLVARLDNGDEIEGGGAAGGDNKRPRGGNIQMMKSRFQTLWGSSHLFLMHLAAFKEAATYWPSFDYIINLSESDYLLRPIEELTSFLDANKGVSFIVGNKMVHTNEFMNKQGVGYTFYQCDSHMFKVYSRSIESLMNMAPVGVKVWGASDWFVLHRDFASYITNPPTFDKLVNQLKYFYAFSLLPSESFFTTLIANSKFCNQFVNSDLKRANWVKGKVGCSCVEKSSVDWCGCSPLIVRNSTAMSFYKEEVIQPHMRKRSIFFARKFDYAVALSAVNDIAVGLSTRATTQTQLPPLSQLISWNSFWLNFFHVSYDSNSKQMILPLNTLISSVLPALVPIHTSRIETRAIRADHYFVNDKYVGDVVTVSLYDARNASFSSLIEGGERGMDEGAVSTRHLASVQMLITPQTQSSDEQNEATSTLHQHYFNPFIFSDYAQVTTKFDGKENISRSFNNWITTYDTSIHVFAPFATTIFSSNLKSNQLKLTIYQSEIPEPFLHHDVYFVHSNDKMLRHEFSILFDENISPKAPWVLLINDGDRIILQQEFLIFGEKSDKRVVDRFWKADELCTFSTNETSPLWNSSNLSIFPKCVNAPWSLYYPDPKSSFFNERYIV